MMKPYCIFACFFGGEKYDAMAWKEMHGGKVEVVSKTNRKAMEVQEVRFVCLGGAKLALEKMAKKEQVQGQNENPSHNNVKRRPLENMWCRWPAPKERNAVKV